MIFSEQTHRRLRQALKSGAVLVLSSVVVFLVVRLVEAGSLTPSTSSPSASMTAASNVYGILASISFSSSAISASPNGGAIQILKCAIVKAKGGSCP